MLTPEQLEMENERQKKIFDKSEKDASEIYEKILEGLTKEQAEYIGTVMKRGDEKECMELTQGLIAHFENKK
jgi:hypothetical protein